MQERARLWGLLVVGLASLAARPVWAFDSFSPTRTETLFERQHGAVLTLHQDHAELVVRRTLYNSGFISDQAMFMSSSRCHSRPAACSHTTAYRQRHAFHLSPSKPRS